LNTREVQNLYMLLTDEDDSSQDIAVDDLTHSQMVTESINVVESLKQQVRISMYVWESTSS
jgi:hypothetical protein